MLSLRGRSIEKSHIVVHVIALVTMSTSIIVSSGASYSQQPKNYVGVGEGARSCAEFGELYKNQTHVEALFFQWAQGMMTGINVVIAANGQETTNLTLRDVKSQMGDIRLYCATNPLAFYLQAVLDLFDRMRREQNLPDWRR